MSTPSSEGWGTSGYGSGSAGSTTDSGSSSDYYSRPSGYTPASDSGSSDSNGLGGGSTAGEATLSRGAITSRTEPTRPMGAQPTTPATHSEGTVTGGSEAASTARAATTTRTQAAAKTKKGPRRVRLAVARVDPWSVMKMSFLLSVALGIAGVILTAVLWMILSTMNVFTDIEGVLQSLQTAGSADNFSIRDYVGFGRVVSLSIVIGVIDVILLTAIATVMAFLYNICSALVGGIQLTLTDD
ncbi:DUF3566 domain-containing protein [Intrasporangium calvum]|uniref:DUF3566 domain-containing protein n=1 Tax=Intrasporangium calvum TaxID=53358 RepID=A0ABT5GCZ3_9MICO|nr:DUF3566 domain-containing protein [Intrasporangium calvum]MDC5696147.1 DUF3566 domain-containing protein [Intrasporangium calvum]